MRIEELILDGFKSYASRTIISGWDAEFNVITGRNGAGKSNVLDAICFVLGITNLQQVRAINLQELIYKNGQAGITKASVTVVFNNEDVAKSPVGFENVPKISIARQIMVGGKNKYMINGRAVLQAAVANLFQSVGLNVNNPNFLIMQGKITKVPKMRPLEVLSMIEEAAGTRMYEERKEKGLKAMAKKDKKIEEIQSLLDEEITPKLDKIRSEKRAYLEFVRVKAEATRLERLCIAHEFWEATEDLKSLQERREDVGRRERECDLELQTINNASNALEAKVVLLKEQRNVEDAGYAALIDLSKGLEKQLVKARAKLESASIARDSKDARVRELHGRVEELESEVEQSKAKEAQAAVEVAKQREVCNSWTAKVDDLLRVIDEGSNTKAGAQEAVYKDQISQCRLSLANAHAEAEGIDSELAQVYADLEKERPLVAKAHEKLERYKERCKHLSLEHQALVCEANSLQYSEAAEAELCGRVKATKDELLALRREIAAITHAHPELRSFHFEYHSPRADFDRSSVKGTVGELVTVREVFGGDKIDASTALEICAGGRLYNVVVETGAIGAELLERGKLTRRVTLIPLDKITPFVLTSHKLQRAQKVGGGPRSVQCALDLVEYPPEVARAIEYVFGGTLVCCDGETSKAVTFDPQVRARSVTLEGDVYDPSGSLSGGSKTSSNGVLQQLKALKSKTGLRDSLQCSLQELEGQWQELGKQRKLSDNLKANLELKAHELHIAEQQLAMQEGKLTVLASLKQLEARLEELEKAKSSTHTKVEAELERLAQLEKDLKEAGAGLSTQIDGLKARLKSEKEQAKRAQRQLRVYESSSDRARLQVQQVNEDLSQLREQLAEASASDLDNVVEGLEREIAVIETKIRSQEVELNRMRTAVSALAEQLGMTQRELKDRKTLAHKVSLELQQVERDSQKIAQLFEKKQAFIANLEGKHDWIEAQKGLFGNPSSAFSFVKFEASKARLRLDELQSSLRELGRSVNDRVMEMSDRLEKKEAQLKQNVKTIRKDKVKIEKTIAKLDAIKREALYKTWQNVNRDFGQTLSEMFPGNTAKLEPPADQDFTAGLEFKVCLGGIWKDNTTELSGGQCSLLALAFLFSILQVKPAPLYILDEVDAALDASHTQNIGKLIRTRFKGAQFIVVSLKDGLFDNANVKFFATFKNNVSCIERHVLRPNAEEKSNEPHKNVNAKLSKRAGNFAVEPLASKC